MKKQRMDRRQRKKEGMDEGGRGERKEDHKEGKWKDIYWEAKEHSRNKGIDTKREDISGRRRNDERKDGRQLLDKRIMNKIWLNKYWSTLFFSFSKFIQNWKILRQDSRLLQLCKNSNWILVPFTFFFISDAVLTTCQPLSAQVIVSHHRVH